MAEPDKKTEEKLEQIFRENLQKAYNKGLRAGIYTASKIVSDKLNDTSKPLMKRIKDVQNYCSVPIKNIEKFLETMPDTTNTEITESDNKSEENPNEND